MNENILHNFMKYKKENINNKKYYCIAHLANGKTPLLY